jgi:ATP-binding cassette, subfamily A (ABC1), member 3
VANGYSFVQNVIANTLLKEATGEPSAAVNVLLVPMQPTEVTLDKFVALNTIFAFEVALAYVLPVFNTVFFLVKEKEQRLKESMRMMGMNDLSYWLSWFIYYSATNLVTALLASATLVKNVFPHTDITVVFMIIWGYG